MPIKTQAELRSELDATIFANPGGQITPDTVHALLLDMIDSAGTGGGPNYAFGTGVATGSGSAGAAGRALGIATGTAVGSGSASAIVSSLSAETRQFFDRLITMPSTARQSVYATFIDALVSAGVWAKLDAMFMYASGDPVTGLTNLIQEPYRGFLDISIGVPAFTDDRGWSGCGPSGLQDVNTNFNPSTAGGNYTQNDAMLCAWQVGSVQENKATITDISADSKIELFSKWSDGHTYWGINGNGAEASSTAPSDASGFWLMQRTGANACELHQNDTSIGTSTNVSAALVNQFVVSCPAANSVACLGIGASLNSGQQTAFYNAVHAYMVAVGAA